MISNVMVYFLYLFCTMHFCRFLLFTIFPYQLKVYVCSTGLRPLHYAAWQGHTKTTEMLLHKGSSVDRPALEGNTPLHLACEHGHFDVVSALTKALHTLNLE